MQARALIGGASFDPKTLHDLYKAFDDAWDQIAPEVSKRGEALEAARMKLAEFVLELANKGTLDPEKLTEAAVAMMRAKPTPLPSP